MKIKPVRIGNAAYSQKQNDIYGILMDAYTFKLTNTEKTMTNMRSFGQL